MVGVSLSRPSAQRPALEQYEDSKGSPIAFAYMGALQALDSSFGFLQVLHNDCQGELRFRIIIGTMALLLHFGKRLSEVLNGLRESSQNGSIARASLFGLPALQRSVYLKPRGFAAIDLSGAN